MTKIKIRLSQYIKDLQTFQEAWARIAKEEGKDEDPIIITDDSFYKEYFSVEPNQDKLTEYFIATGEIPPGFELIIDLEDEDVNKK